MSEPTMALNPTGEALEELVDLGPEMFADVSGTVINYQGENYYKSCGAHVADKPEGGFTFCVLPVRFPHDRHRDSRGITTEGEGDVLVSLTAIPRNQTEVSVVATAMADAFEGLMRKGIRVSMHMDPGGDDS